MIRGTMASFAAMSFVLAMPALAQEEASAPAPSADAVAPAPVDAPIAEDAPAAVPAIVTKSGTIGPAPADKAQVVFWRPGTLMGAALGCTVHEKEAEVARLGAGKYWVTVVDAGKHLYFTQGEAKDTLPMELETGETYFVRCSEGMGIVAGRPLLSPSTRAEFAKRAKGMRLWEKKPS